jgi:TPR repeat protein
MLAKGDIANAFHWFERADHQGYSVAKIDLAGLLLDASGLKQDVGRAITLYEEAWRNHVPIAGARLAALYEHGAPGLSADTAKAQHWLKLGADSLEPEALGHIAEQTEIAAAPAGGGPLNDHLLLQALALYTLASEQARLQAWPDAVYKVWRYRRATLARVLAHDGLIREVVETYRSNIKAGGKGKTTD